MKARLIVSLLAALALAAWAAAPAGAVDLEDFDVLFEGAGGTEAMAAGEHPFALRTSFEVEDEVIDGKTFPVEAVKDLRIELVTGLSGTLVAVQRCAAADFLVNGEKTAAATGCGDSAVVGTITVEVGEAGEAIHFAGAVYNMQPAPGFVAKLGFRLPGGVRVTVDIGLSEEYPYAALATLRNIAQAVEFFASDFVVWGNPAAEAHDPLRGECLKSIPTAEGELVSQGECSAGIPEVAFLVNPRACEGPLTTTWETTSWDNPTAPPARDIVLTHDAFGNPRGFSGCGELPFEPSLLVQPSARSAASASGLQVDIGLSTAGLTDPEQRAATEMKKVVVTLPKGMTINPAQAEGLSTCSEADLGRESADSPPGAGCPQQSKVGTVEVKTPVLPDETFKGEVFVATPYKNPFGSLIALYMTIKDPERGVSITTAGRVSTDPVTGQIVTTFGDPTLTNDAAFQAIPQQPISSVRVRLREGGRSPLITPPGCGPSTATAEFTSWADPTSARSQTSTFQIDSGPGGGPCPAGAAPFAPGFEAGTLNNAAKSFSPFLMRLTRKDGEQDITRFSSVLPPGVAGILAGISRCPDAKIAKAISRSGEHGGEAELAEPSCEASSQIGTTLAGAGVGSQLLYVPGKLYLAGPYKGAPLSVVAIVPAVAGPFDAGTVVVRVGLTLNPLTGQAEVDGAASDPIPHILQGIPLNVRELRVAADRPNFTFNATSCDEEQVKATLWGGGTALLPLPDSPVALAARYQAASCASLGFKPKLALRLKGGTSRGAHPALRAVVTPRPADANFAKAVVTLPRSAFLDQAHIRTICTRVQFAAGAGHGAECPKGSIYGKARAWTPILEEPAEGPVFLRSSNHNLPDMVIALKGPPAAAAEVELSARIDSKRGGIRGTFTGIPDLPVSRFVLELQGGAKGLIVNSMNLCSRTNRAEAIIDGQNGKRHRAGPAMRASGCGEGRKGRRAADTRVRR